MGSLYGVPSTEYSEEKEIAGLLKKMAPMITKPNSFMKDGDIEQKFAYFQEKTRQIMEEEQNKQINSDSLLLNSDGSKNR